nr:Protein Y9C2UA.1, isoform b [Haemonchus contortus]
MYGPSFGFTSLEFVRKFLLKWLMENGFVDGAGEGGEFMETVMKVAEYAITAMPWFVLLVPLAQVLLAVICIEMFREQFFFVFSCGRFYEGPPLTEYEKSKRWASLGKTFIHGFTGS